MSSLHDTETKTLAAISEGLKSEYIDPEKDIWAGSPFAWILTRPSRQRGKIGEQLIEGWCVAHGLSVQRSPDSDADRIIEGKRIEIKLSTLWAGGHYTFQQIRDQRYDYLLCIGISPFTTHAWIMQKSELPIELMPHQHGGSAGNDTRWLTVRPDAVPPRLSAFGGTLEEVLTVLKGFRDQR